jgi:chromosome segregation ATPase
MFIVLEATGQNVSRDIVDKDQDDIGTQQKIKNDNEINDQCQVLSEEMKEMREFKDRIKKDFTEAKATTSKQGDQISQLEEKNGIQENQISKQKDQTSKQEDQIRKLKEKSWKQEDQISKLEEKNRKHEKQLNKMEQLLQDLISRGKDQNDKYHKMKSNKHLF